jgi:Cu(I)-responsive transcriptional regulator
MITIGDAAERSGVSAKRIRHYESIGLIAEADRSEAGYRLYDAHQVEELGFIRRARDLGFSIEQIEDLLALWRDRERSSADVKRLAMEHVADLEARIVELQAMAGALKHLAATCHGDDRPECPIIQGLAGAPAAPRAGGKAPRTR